MMHVRPSEARDVAYLAPRLREADLMELEAGGAPSASQSLTDGLNHSLECMSIVDDEDNAQAMFGVVPSEIDELGYVWLLGSYAIETIPTQFLRCSKVWIDKLNTDFPVLTNYVDKRNTVHIKWLKWLGFTFLREVKGLGPGGHPFIEFARIQHV